MNNYPIINRKFAVKNKNLKLVQKKNKMLYEKGSCKTPKVLIPKLVLLRDKTNCIDMTNEQNMEIKTINIKNAEDLISVVRSMGLKGQSGNGFPTADKLEAFCKCDAEKYIVINGAECDPGLIHDEWLLNNKLDSIKRGIEVLHKVFKPRDIVLAVKKVDTDLSFLHRKIKALQNILGMNNFKVSDENLQGNYRVQYIPNRYPIGEERLLIQQVLGRNIDYHEIPAKKGILVLNVQTIFAIGQIIEGTYKRGSRYITVMDMRSGEGVVARVKREMKISEVASKAFKGAEAANLAYGGGIMLAHDAAKEESIDEKTFFIGIGESVSFNDLEKCKKCGRCTKNCPAGLQVMKMVNILQKDANADISEYDSDKCLKCGTCTYFCYAGKNVMKIIAEGQK